MGALEMAAAWSCQRRLQNQHQETTMSKNDLFDEDGRAVGPSSRPLTVLAEMRRRAQALRQKLEPYRALLAELEDVERAIRAIEAANEPAERTDR